MLGALPVHTGAEGLVVISNKACGRGLMMQMPASPSPQQGPVSSVTRFATWEAVLCSHYLRIRSSIHPLCLTNASQTCLVSGLE